MPDLVREAVLEVIADRHLKPGDQLLPEPALAAMLAVSRATLREAIRMLELEGVLLRTRGVGTFVAGAPFLRNNLNANFGVTDLIRSEGHVPGTVDRTAKITLPTATVRTALGLAEGAQAVVIERTRTADGRPVVRSTDILPTALIPAGVDPLTVGEESLYKWLQTRCGVIIHHGVARIQSVAATAPLANLLNVRRGTPLLLLEQVDYAGDNRPALYSLEYHVSDAFEVTIQRAGPRRG
ncbi:MAG TPA: GntR family transcriptional regulator [bacterium]|nr:GntR family transcriptional regulator [bacterium]